MYSFMNTVQILCIGTDRSQQTVQTKIRLLLKKRGHNVCFRWEMRKINFKYRQYPLLSGALEITYVHAYIAYKRL